MRVLLVFAFLVYFCIPALLRSAFSWPTNSQTPDYWKGQVQPFC